MPAHTFNRYRSASAAAAATALLLTIAACTPAASPAASTAAPTNSATGLPSSHIHGLTVNRETDQVLLATHDGLYDVTAHPATKIGGTNDLMGFTAGADQGVFYASGHPGPGSDLPNPMGLIKSTDGGKSWEQLSRQGESDFHALTSAKSGIVAFDGTLRTSPDGKTWSAVAARFIPAALAADPFSDTVLATTRDGVQRSTDGGKTWVLAPATPVIQFVTFASPAEAIGVEPDGSVHYSADGGATWSRTGRIEGQVHAIAAVEGSGPNPWVWAATSAGLVVSTDGGATFRPSDAV
ncbi:exo-alpha-sialidase [Pseudarthrobacter psychrotolerans]|uniref:Exo-alpha-sialidase n=1 Tax=Pseudarthrobacter psychrotolerans TaxID=2697569 RepID=A0A6P1NHY6_9MICC|nr:exo-alpha-sialidase [Pseudarthrobacter psychrotolerans]QHK20225.1 exo-alpha-sialidase [Pseudarthrobacter psychrotolerans]